MFVREDQRKATTTPMLSSDQSVLRDTPTPLKAISHEGLQDYADNYCLCCSEDRWLRGCDQQLSVAAPPALAHCTVHTWPIDRQTVAMP